jgi:hypothetical protein
MQKSQTNQGLHGGIHEKPDQIGRVFRNNRNGFVEFATKTANACSLSGFSNHFFSTVRRLSAA